MMAALRAEDYSALLEMFAVSFEVMNVALNSWFLSIEPPGYKWLGSAIGLCMVDLSRLHKAMTSKKCSQHYGYAARQSLRKLA
jgi:hypothetical protein